MITPSQIRAARALLDWSQVDLAGRADLSKDSIKNIETGQTSPQLQTLLKIKTAFEEAGITFTDDDGVKRRRYEIDVLKGQQGFWDFYDDIYNTIKQVGGEMLIHNVDERLFTKWLGDKISAHRERMHQLGNFSQKVIICEGDTNFAVNYKTTEYRWADKKDFSPMPFYLYGQKLAMILFESDNVSIFMIDQPEIAQSYRGLFMAAWNKAKVPTKGKQK